MFTCDNNHGGVAHVRNGILNCVRFAIGAGGMLVLPNIALRDMDHEFDHDHDEEGGHSHLQRRHGPGRRGFDYMFDKRHFVDSLAKSCPDLVLLRSMANTDSPRRRSVTPEQLFGNIPTTGIKNPQDWPHLLGHWINQHIAKEPKKEPIIIDLEQSFLSYPTHSDGHAIAHAFGKILKFRKDFRVLATSVLQEMDKTYDLALDLHRPILSPSFLGAHLATEDPFTSVWKRSEDNDLAQEDGGMSGSSKRHTTEITYSHFEPLAEAILTHAAASQISLVYAASGNLPEVHELGEQALKFNITVAHKEDLLQGKELKNLEALKYDQRAIVDFLVLTKGEGFAGVGHSGFSWNVAMKRRELGAAKEGRLQEDVWTDGSNVLFGVSEGYVESSECLWP